MVRKIFLSSFWVLALFLSSVKPLSAISPIFNQPGQGMFQCHADNKIGADYMKGGGVIVFWNILQPQNNGQLDQTAVNALIDNLKRSKTRYLHFMIYGQNGQPGGIVMPTWLNVYDNDPNNDLIGVLNDGTGIYPQPWDSRYQEKLEQFLNLLSSALQNAGVMDKIEYIEPSAGGYWGSTHLYIADDKLKAWARAAGCQETDWSCLGTKYTDGVNKVLEKYLTAFPQKATMVISGSCKYSGCSYGGFNQMVDKYGLRVMVKAAGLGAPEQGACGIRNTVLAPFCGGSNAKTKCGQEQSGVSKACGGGNYFNPEVGCGYYDTYIRSLKEEKISYYCLYNSEIGCQAVENGRKIDDINKEVAEKLGAQILLLSSLLDGIEKNVNSNLKIDFVFANQGSTALIASLKQGIKWVSSSYKLFLEFVKDGQVVHYQELSVNPPTNTWTPANFSKEVSFSINLQIPPSLGGPNQTSRLEYKIYTGFTDPNGEKVRFALINTGAKNDLSNKRYLLAESFTVIGQGQNSTSYPTQPPTASPTPTRTPTLTRTPTPTPSIPLISLTPSLTPTGTLATPTNTPAISLTSTPTNSFPCPNGEIGNINCDLEGKINEIDLNLLLENWATFGPVPVPASGQHHSDLNRDGRVDESDLTILLTNWFE